MKAVILAGGLGTRLSEETSTRPKPMVEIGGKPILWHIMKMYSYHGITDFIVCCGYKGYVIKEYFANYFLHMSDVTLNMKDNEMTVHHMRAEPWTVTLVDTGDNSMTGGRLRRVAEHIKDEDAFCFTYGDGVSDVDISETIRFHKAHGKQSTLTATYPPGRFGALDMKNGLVRSFKEKPKGDGAMINGGFFVLSPKVLELIDGDNSTWEQQPLMTLAEKGELMAYEHKGFWQPMDTLRDKVHLEELWQSGKAPWKNWE
ncbi:glucose-1-phosphate cytidylyltransferase [Marinomonas primoryensis]|uniref:Glucose-1-phosphate cytidylyltransferase n=1 Tax=Marinomonas primoryensis TaxID=178399 RepID=A0A2Z4PX12_9GAMM|nr:glucose-1-phosphate cytidylyltransferase [Marinomonas primoryensis]AWY01063.1 glucose-1-phosphate cytidylyltransferase [Marinomonas primoryensis]AWY02118.1 glucose-1-phosphate cytidylyltransferase [Marinomonas primoryensis]